MEIDRKKWVVTVLAELFLESEEWNPEQISQYLGIEPDRTIVSDEKLSNMSGTCIAPKNALVLTQFRGIENSTFVETNSLFKGIVEEILNRVDLVQIKKNNLHPHISMHLVVAICAGSTQPQWCSFPVDLIKRLAAMEISVMVTWKKMEEGNLSV